MGSNRSKFEAVTNETNSELIATTTNGARSKRNEKKEDEKFKCVFPPIFSFCNPGNEEDRKKANNPFGTPILTPTSVRKKRSKLFLNSTQSNFLEKEPSAYNGFSEQRDPKSEAAQIHNDSATSGSSRSLTEKYELLEVLGVGSTSTCYRAMNRITGESFACKMIDKTFVTSHYQGMFDQFQCEIMALKSLHHPNIIRLYDVFVTNDKIYIVMELMKGGELFDYVVQRGTLTETEASEIMLKVTSALVYMHSKKIIHRDLKPENLLLKTKPSTTSQAKNNIDVKIIDFGLCKTLEEPLAKSFLGTRGYLAPEMLQRKNYSTTIDTWALGVIMYVLLCGCLPFDDDSQPISSPQIRKKFIIKYPRWATGLSPEAKDLLSHLLDINPMTRYTAEQAIGHAWMANYKDRPKTSSIKQKPTLELEDNGNFKKSQLLPPTTPNNNRHRINSDTTFNVQQHYQMHHNHKPSMDDSCHSRGSNSKNKRVVHRVPFNKKRSVDI